MVPTRKLARIACFYPGLPQLWNRGSWVGLVVAVGFTALANTLLLATCVYDEWIPPQHILGGTIALAVVWLFSLWRSRVDLRRSGNQEIASQMPHDESATSVAVALGRQVREQLFIDAQRVYLAGDWVATEQLLLKLLKEDARDVQGRLMLATLWRRQGRYSEALRQLDKLARLEAADEWQYEIAAERQEINERQELAATTVSFEQEANNEHTNEISAEEPSDQQEMNNETNRRLAA
ncbi:hypothetical protein [Bythopirellula polymerisocia]|uniref:Tetratricopeptide repeat protein n=1 Tax=Bythopirellula polymerisocia TaxID=2528003 RepID=A0A5C6CF42_9BACT|nr:hypothetical protein [Bythopirellula polymerisocia]TWU21926.1 hypothetical protein Pla144_43930 [Bythopirellula polymerisocia]